MKKELATYSDQIVIGDHIEVSMNVKTSGSNHCQCQFIESLDSDGATKIHLSEKSPKLVKA